MKKNILKVISFSMLFFGGISLRGAEEDPFDPFGEYPFFSGFSESAGEDGSEAGLPFPPNEKMAYEATMEALQPAMEGVVKVTDEEINPVLRCLNSVHIYTASRQVLIAHRNALGQGTIARLMFPQNNGQPEQPVAVQCFNLIGEQLPQEGTPWLFNIKSVLPFNQAMRSVLFSPLTGTDVSPDAYPTSIISLPGNFSTAIQYLLSGFDLPTPDSFWKGLWEFGKDLSDRVREAVESWWSGEPQEENKEGDDSAEMVAEYRAQLQSLEVQRQSEQDPQEIAKINQRIASIREQLNPAGYGTMDYEPKPYECDVYINDQYVGHAVNGQFVAINGPFVDPMYEATYNLFLELSRDPGLLEQAVTWCRKHPGTVKFAASLVLFVLSGEIWWTKEVVNGTKKVVNPYIKDMATDLLHTCGDDKLTAVHGLLARIGYFLL